VGPPGPPPPGGGGGGGGWVRPNPPPGLKKKPGRGGCHLSHITFIPKEHVFWPGPTSPGAGERGGRATGRSDRIIHNALRSFPPAICHTRGLYIVFRPSILQPFHIFPCSCFPGGRNSASRILQVFFHRRFFYVSLSSPKHTISNIKSDSAFLFHVFASKPPKKKVGKPDHSQLSYARTLPVTPSDFGSRLWDEVPVTLPASIVDTSNLSSL